ncbi:TrlF family AAA-like ATPase [Cloacibacillus porcorum]|uniref:TrlF family AAA-like ATPase n=1 Tax=Cloacibacillus porcorum TaxID=1197717 RepID=UPI00248DC694|nr:hypothetical protein [Cloacibacillus porcorum]
MFESGLEYVRADFHLHTQKDKEFTYSGEKNDFVKSYATALKQANISVGIITNHNKFDKDEYKALKRAASKESIFILPGVELTVKEGSNGIHTLIIFNPDEWLENGNNHIQTFLTAAFATISNPENRNTKCCYDLKNTLEKLEEYGRDYFVIFAHVDQSSGLFSECGGGLLESLSGLAPFRKRVLGLQKSRTRDNIDKFSRCFGYVPALIEGSDPKSLKDIGKGDKQTYLKIGEYSYSAIKFALQDYKNRASELLPEQKHGYIESIYFQGGKFDGQTVRFSSELNSLIGIRGSGKSSVLEAIRYMFDQPVQTDKEYKDSLIKNIFGSGGKAVLTVTDKHGKRYFISRIYGERSNVVDENGTDLNIQPSSLFDGIQYFGQKDLSNSADHENGLLEKLVGGKIGETAEVTSYVSELTTAISQLLDVSKIPEQIEECETKKSELEHKMSIYKEKGVAEKLKKQTGYTTDKTRLDSASGKIDSAIKELKQVFVKNQGLSISLQKINSNYNPDIIEKAVNILSLIGGEIAKIGEAIAQIENYRSEFIEVITELSAKIDSLADEFAEIKREIQDNTLDIDGYVKMTAELEKYKETLQQLEGRAKSKEQIESAFKKAARERNDTLLSQFRAYQDETQKINETQSELRISIDFKGDREGFKSQMKSDFRGSGISDSKYQSLCDAFRDYVELIEDWILSDGEKIKKIISLSEYGKLDKKLQEQYPELLKNQVPNKVEIYYHEKLLRHHSIGQRASALILFILMQSDNDIILIDQPEDDLDNKIIYDEVITAITRKKQGMQFIFATHNANIPVLGDAERVFVVEYQDTKIDISQGNIDLETTHKQIVDIMEGGKEAFDKRQLIYTSWK